MRVVFSLNQQGSWLGGTSYYYNLLNALKLVSASNEHRLIGLFSNGDSLHTDLHNLLNEMYEVEDGGWLGKTWRRILIRLSYHTAPTRLIPESPISCKAREVGGDVLFLKDGPFVNFRVPIVCWFPDFQYLHMPEMFPANTLAAYKNTALQMAKYATKILLSSQSVLNDFKLFLPEYVDKVGVVPFVAWIEDDIYRADPEPLRIKYHLPQKFFYLPNQFWEHKNHRIVLDALELALMEDSDIVIAASGDLKDFRNPLYPSQFAADINRRGLQDKFILLGAIPRKDVYGLMRLSLAVLQPSLFEGWSTSIEEAKSLGKQVVASNLDVHREQNAPGAIFFDPHRPDELASILVKVHSECVPGVNLAAEATAREGMRERALSFGKAFMVLLTEAAS